MKAANEPLRPPFALITLDYPVTQEIAANEPASIAGLVSQNSRAPNDLIAEGDEVSVSIFEAADGGLFARSNGATTFGPAPVAPSAPQQNLQHLVVDRDGDVPIPFAGRVRVAGLTPAEASERIRLSLVGKAVDPQVSLIVANSRLNTVGVLGAVRNPGHYPLGPSNDRLLDVLESAGGTTQPPGDALVVVYRDGHLASATLAEIMTQPADNIRLAPKDEVRVLDQPRKFLTFGAVGRASEVPILDRTLTLAGALSRVGGLDTNQANAHWVMVFRFERPEIARALGVAEAATPKGVPIVYRLDLRDPQGFFVAENFNVQSQDLIYVARSDLSETRKFLEFVQAVTSINYSVSAQAATIP